MPQRFTVILHVIFVKLKEKYELCIILQIKKHPINMFKPTFRRFSLLWSLLCIAIVLQAQIPSNYYSSAKGAKGKALKTALYKIVSSHTALSYDALWDAYKTTDVRADGKIWDMYSNKTNYTVNDHGGSYKGEGDIFNREHSFPKSWFNDAKPMYTDLFHLYPTDGYVNGRRSNYPYGENEGEIYSSNGGFSKLGKCTIPGYSGTVFEPNDEYKGDLARSYFYMATAYEDKIANWNSDMLAHNAYPAYADWALTMLLRWAQEDPVSQKEIDRNNAVYKLQHNRNPYIDYPGLEQYVWGAKTTTAFDPDNYDGSTPTPPDIPDTPTEVAAPTFSPVAGAVAKGTTVTISTTTEGATIYYTVNEGDLQTAYMSAKEVVNATSHFKAYAMLGENKSAEVEATYTVATEPIVGENVYVMATNDEDLKAGTNLLIVCTNKGVAMSGISDNKSYRKPADVEVTADNTITTDVNAEDKPYVFTLGGTKGAWTLFDATTSTYLALHSNNNELTSIATANAEAQWTITITNNADIKSNNITTRSIKYNSGSPRFSTYTQGQQPVQIFVAAKNTAILETLTSGNRTTEVYNLNGHLVSKGKTCAEAFKGIPAGLYIVNGKKVIVR